MRHGERSRPLANAGGRSATPKRQESIEALGLGEYESVQQFARELDRDKGQVSRDLKTLSKHATISSDEQDRSKPPWLNQEHVVVEPIV